MANKFDLEKSYHYQVANGETSYWKYGSSAHTSLKLSGAIAYYNKLVASGVFQADNPWIYCKSWRIAGTLNDICNVTCRPAEEILSQSFNPSTDQGRELIQNELKQYKTLTKKDPLSSAQLMNTLEEYVNQNPRGNAQKVVASAAVEPAKILKISQNGLNKKLEAQWLSVRELMNETVQEKKRILNISNFNKVTYTGVQKQKLTKAEAGISKRSSDKTALVTLNGRSIPFKFSLTDEAKAAALDYAEYVIKPLAENCPELTFTQGTIQEVYQAIVQTAQEYKTVSKSAVNLQIQVPSSSVVDGALDVLNSISAAPPSQSYEMFFNKDEYKTITDDLDHDDIE